MLTKNLTYFLSLLTAVLLAAFSGVAEGNATITVESEDGEYSATCAEGTSYTILDSQWGNTYPYITFLYYL